MSATGSAVIGLDLGGTKLLAGLFDDRDQLVRREYIPVGSFADGDLLGKLAAVVNDLASSSDLPVAGVGYGMPTTFDQRTGTAVVAANLPIRDLPVRDELERLTGIPSFVDNDANVAALAEQRKGIGAQSGVRNLIMVTLGTGFGGGVVIDGAVLHGAIGAAGELGHMSIDRNGPACVAPACPGIGCIETFCSGSALRRDAQEFVAANPASPMAARVAGGEEARGELVVAMAEEGDADAIGLLTAMGRNLGVALINFVNIFNPEMIVIGGGLVSAQEWVLPAALDVVRERALLPGSEYVKVVPASFGNDAGMIGAAVMAREGAAGSANAGVFAGSGAAHS